VERVQFNNPEAGRGRCLNLEQTEAQAETLEHGRSRTQFRNPSRYWRDLSGSAWLRWALLAREVWSVLGSLLWNIAELWRRRNVAGWPICQRIPSDLYQKATSCCTKDMHNLGAVRPLSSLDAELFSQGWEQGALSALSNFDK
jgi:hypothetical protein